MIELLLEFPVFLLLVGKGKKAFVFCFICYVCICAVLYYFRKKKNNGKSVSTGIRYFWSTIFICITAAVFFYLRWYSSGRIITFSNIIRRAPRQTCIIISILLALLSSRGVDYIISIILSIFGKYYDWERINISNRFIYAYLFLTAFLTITLNSRCSPLYPFNDWVDPNTMFTVGKGVLKGYVPYRDLYEQKGPIFVFFHTIGSSISFNTFLGIWILEIIACFFFICMIYKTIKLYYDRKVFLFIPIISMVIYSSYAFRTGDSAEEFCLPLLAYCLFSGCKTIKSDQLPSKKEFLILGVTSACVFWIKYSLLGLYLGWFILFFSYSVIKKVFRQFLCGIGIIISGLIFVTLPIFVYFLLNGSLHYLFEAYFYNILFYYVNESIPLSGKMLEGLKNISLFDPAVFFICGFGILWTLYRRYWKVFLFLIIELVCVFFFVYIGGKNHSYYCLVFNIFACFGSCFWIELFIPFLNSIRISKVKETLTTSAVISLFSGIAALCFFSLNLPYMEYEKEELMQFKMKKIIEQSSIENPTLLNYGGYLLDCGVNTVAGLIPNLRFFCMFNNENLSIINEEQEKCLNEGCVDFVITYSKYEEDHPDLPAYDYQGWIPGTADFHYGYYHYYIRK